MPRRPIVVIFPLLGIVLFAGIFSIVNRITSEETNDLIVTTDRAASNPPIENQPQTNQLELQTQPFQELTIPYLRTLDYTSELRSLKRFEEKPSYTSYVTSYLSDGLQINALLTLPKGEAPENGWPAVVFVHGYIPPDSYRTTERYVAYVDYLAQQGMVVFKIDLRGHGESEGEANGAYYSSEYVRDVLFAYSALENYELVDKTKIGLWGHSMAGNVILRAIAVQPTIPTAVIWAGAVYSYEDWKTYGLSDHSFRLTDLQRSDRLNKRKELFDTHGEFDPTNQFWQTVVPTNYLAEVTTAIQLHHATDDAVVSIGYSKDLVPLLEKAGIKHEFYEYKTGGHNITGGSFSQAMARSVEWFNQEK